MSLENAKKFLKRMKTDEAFKAKVMAVADVEGRQKLAKDEGYMLTDEEVQSAAEGVTDGECRGDEGGHRVAIGSYVRHEPQYRVGSYWHWLG